MNLRDISLVETLGLAGLPKFMCERDLPQYGWKANQKLFKIKKFNIIV